MSKLQFDFEIIHKINESKEIKKEQILELVGNAPRQLIFKTASNLRDKKKGKTVRKISDILVHLQREKSIGDEMILSVYRNGDIIELTMILEERPR